MPDTFSCKEKKKKKEEVTLVILDKEERRDDATHYFLHRSIGNMARNMERGRIPTSAMASMYLQDTETWHRQAGGLSPQQPALSPVDQVCNCQRWLQTVRTHRQRLVAGLGVNAKFPLSAVRTELICGKLLTKVEKNTSWLSGIKWKERGKKNSVSVTVTI